MSRWCCWLSLEERRPSVDAHWFATICLAVLKCAGAVVSGHVPVTAHHIIYMLAIRGGIPTGLASSDTELSIREKIRPLVELLKCSKSIRKDEAANRITIPICSMWIKLSTTIPMWNVDECQVPDTCDLNKIWCLDEMCAFDGAIRY